jgi:hypothetical protein
LPGIAAKWLTASERGAEAEGKLFFSEEKNQKTFGLLGYRSPGHGYKSQKFFGSFFQKRTAFFD